MCRERPSHFVSNAVIVYRRFFSHTSRSKQRRRIKRTLWAAREFQSRRWVFLVLILFDSVACSYGRALYTYVDGEVYLSVSVKDSLQEFGNHTSRVAIKWINLSVYRRSKLFFRPSYFVIIQLIPPPKAGLNLARIGSGPHLLPRRRALLIGIRSGTTRIQRSNTSQTDISTETLLGPHDDVNSLKKLLSDFGYEDPVVLMDDPDMGPSLQPTYANIMRELSRFLAGQKPGDKFFFGYAGHSSQKKNLDGTEKDGLDEFIIPSDASDFKNGDYSRVILDDVLKEKLVVPLLAGSQLVAVLDTCHSATLFGIIFHATVQCLFMTCIKTWNTTSVIVWDHGIA
ncbi:caspase domain-containing protein [Mycena sp. CBHHK59/15]|nr:caspase domain-containing protein [Mycena sp. CBHHK59/15]